MSQTRIPAFTMLLLMGLSTHSDAQDLSGSQIRGLVTGKLVVLSTSYGKFPLRYFKNKTVTGDGTKTGLVKFFAPKETGTWWVTEKKLCQRWPTWYDGKPFCFTIAKTGETEIKWVRDDGYSGTAIVSN